MNIFNFIKKKYIRLQGSKNILKFNYFVEKNFRDEKLGNIGFNFSNKPTRQFIVQNIIKSKNFESYLEIGTFHDDLFKHIKCNKKVGVDPISGGTVRKTSDQFFNDNKDKFDCIFIDGLHYYSQVKKDIENSIKILNPNGVILLHDCLPNNHFEQAVPRCQWTWNGDVWKAIVECRIKENIDTYTCYADFGVGVIFNRKNKNLLKLNRQNFSNLKFKDYFFKHKEFMNIIEYEDLMKII